MSWSHDDPRPAFEDIRECVSFYPGRIACSVDEVQVQAQPGGFYGGWITPELVLERVFELIDSTPMRRAERRRR